MRPSPRPSGGAVARAAGATALAVLTTAASVPATPGYLRYPDVHGERVVFCAEGDIWSAPIAGGAASRLTAADGLEYFPRFSPDGTTLAFTGEYAGNRDVFTIPATGGEPVRLTWHPLSDEVLGWTPDGREILFRSPRDDPHGEWHVYAVPLEGGDARQLPLGRASRVTIDPVSGSYAINRIDLERATWKRYRGGSNADIWVGRPGEEFRKVTTFSGDDLMPMWWGDRLYFACDEGGTRELWSMRPDGTDRRRLTDHGEWDVRYPELGDGGRIAYMIAGDIGLYDIATGTDRRLVIELPSERVHTRERIADVASFLTEVALSPDGRRLAIVARGDVFMVPVTPGVTLPVVTDSGARERGAAFAADGERIFYVSDAAGEEEIRAIDAWGRGEPTIVVPARRTGWRFPPAPSPDGRWVAWGDETQALNVSPVAGGETRVIDRSPQAEIAEYAWSPDGRYLAYTRAPRTEFTSIFVWDARDGTTHRITTDETIDGSPVWDPQGRWLAFLSERTIDPVLGERRDFENVDVLGTKPYLVLLRRDVPNPFEDLAGLPSSDEAEEAEEAEDDVAAPPVEIEWDGLMQRVVEVPVDAGILERLGATATHLYWISRPVRGIVELEASDGRAAPDGQLVMYDLDARAATVVTDGVSTYVLAAPPDDRPSRLAVIKGPGEICVIDAGAIPDDDLAGAAVSLDGVVIDVDPRAEWRQIFHEGWRHMRDFTWTADLAGVDWPAVRDRYASLLPRLAVRDDLRDLMGEVIGELATSHTYVWGGDPGRESEPTETGLLGADVLREGDAYRIARILRGGAPDPDRSPLESPGVHVEEGEYIVSVNHRPLPSDRPLEAALEHLAGRRVVLGIARDARGRNARDVVVTPIADEGALRYADWVRRTRERVAAATGDSVGYVHIPDMGSAGLIAFNRWFYPQLDKSGMIVDCRWNVGGYISEMLVSRFRRTIAYFDRSRAGGVWSYPSRALNGPFVVLVNEQAGSDGDIFPYVCQREGLAPVIGQRSWGGVIGYRGDKDLVDGGGLTQPEYAMWDPARGWVIENHGVDPDIEVANAPHDEAAGRDPQLERAIVEVLARMRRTPPVRPAFDAPIPDKSRRGFAAREGAARDGATSDGAAPSGAAR